MGACAGGPEDPDEDEDEYSLSVTNDVGAQKWGLDPDELEADVGANQQQELEIAITQNHAAEEKEKAQPNITNAGTLNDTEVIEEKENLKGKDSESLRNSGCELCLSSISDCINGIFLILTALHLNISLVLLLIVGDDGCGCNRAVVNVIWSITAIVTSVLVSYFGFVHTGIYNEFQSWMYAYISWITITWLQFLLDVVVGAYSRRNLKILSYIRMKILGITMTKKKRLYKDRYKDHWMVTISSLLPMTVVGFVANYILEEKFVLQCSLSLKSGDICYDDGRGCCVVISSHDIENISDFLARLASHLLAIFGIIRIVAWFMLSRNRKIRKIAKKN